LAEESEQGLFSRVKSWIPKKFHHAFRHDLAEEIHDLMDEGQARGLISNEESHMVWGVLDLKETLAHSIMIPRTEISSASLNATLGEIIELVNNCGHTRIPIHHDNIDQIAGILHAKDLLKLWGEDPQSKIPPETLRAPYFVPESQKVSELLRDLKEKKMHLAIVTDDYGGTAGIITIEDILEEIVGEILDEHDSDEALLSPVNESSALVDARLEIRKLEEYLGLEFPPGEYESVGGFIIHLLGRLPKVEEKVSSGNVEFTVRKANHRKIDKVMVTRKPDSDLPREERAEA